MEEVTGAAVENVVASSGTAATPRPIRKMIIWLNGGLKRDQVGGVGEEHLDCGVAQVGTYSPRA